MQLIIFISSRLRNGQFPRLPDFQFSNQFGRYIYGGKTLSPDEFNQVAEKVFNERYRGNGFQFCAAVVDAVADETPVVIQEKIAPPTQPESPVEKFSLDGRSIVMNGERVGGLFGEGDATHIRIVSVFRELRPEIEAWLKSQNLLPQ